MYRPSLLTDYLVVVPGWGVNIVLTIEVAGTTDPVPMSCWLVVSVDGCMVVVLLCRSVHLIMF